jgi:hypothetical protein
LLFNPWGTLTRILKTREVPKTYLINVRLET